MCENQIQKAAKEVNGVTKADWDKTTNMLKVVFDNTKTSTDNIEVAVAKVGHDTPNHNVSNEF